MAIAIAVVAIVVGIIAYTERVKPAASGTIDGTWFSQPTNIPEPNDPGGSHAAQRQRQDSLHQEIKAAITTDQGEQSDDAAAAKRRRAGYSPGVSRLRAGHAAPLHPAEMKIPPGGVQKGSVMVSLPVTPAQFDARKDLTVTIRALLIRTRSSFTKRVEQASKRSVCHPQRSKSRRDERIEGPLSP